MTNATGPTWQNPVPAKPKKTKVWPWLLFVAVALIVGIIIGAAVTGGSSTTTSAAPSTVVSTVIQKAAAAPAASTVTQTQTVTTTPAAKASFGDGTWRVGTDIQPGTYHTAGGDGCYWERSSSTSGSGDDIIANDNASGPTTVTIAPTDAAFKSQNCGTWTLQ